MDWRLGIPTYCRRAKSPLVRIVQSRVSICLTKPEGSSSLPADASPTDKSYLDVQDALLARHLKAHLAESGAAAYVLVVDPQSIAHEGRPKDAGETDVMAMVVDEVDGLVNRPVDLPHLHLHPSTNHSILSYQQLVASMHMRRCLFPRRSPTKLSSRTSQRTRYASKLSQLVSLQ